MLILTDAGQYALGPSVVALGKFDGVHIGHARLLSAAARLAAQLGAKSVAVTFDRHPMELFMPQRAPRALAARAEKQALIERLGVDVMIENRFTVQFAAMEPEEFLDNLCAALRPAAIVLGHRCSFGRGGRGDARMIQDRAASLGYRALIEPPVRFMGEEVSSTRIRQLLADGMVERANGMLGRVYRLTCAPRADALKLPEKMCWPGDGPYTVRLGPDAGRVRARVAAGCVYIKGMEFNGESDVYFEKEGP